MILILGHPEHINLESFGEAFKPLEDSDLTVALRVLKPGGTLIVVDALEHDRVEYRETMGHLWMGFRPEQLEQWLATAGFDRRWVSELAAQPDAMGPPLLVASGRNRESPGSHHYTDSLPYT